MKERMNEGLNEWTSEGMNEWMDEMKWEECLYKEI